ncbi:hypothetical protein ACKS0A_07529 [Histoplasma ohiense]
MNTNKLRILLRCLPAAKGFLAHPYQLSRPVEFFFFFFLSFFSLLFFFSLYLAFFILLLYLLFFAHCSDFPHIFMAILYPSGVHVSNLLSISLSFFFFFFFFF